VSSRNFVDPIWFLVLADGLGRMGRLLRAGNSQKGNKKQQ